MNEQKAVNAPTTMPELRAVLSTIMVGVLNGTVDQDKGRLAINASSRIIESVQAETRARALAYATRQIISADMPLTTMAFSPAPMLEGGIQYEA